MRPFWIWLVLWAAGPFFGVAQAAAPFVLVTNLSVQLKSPSFNAIKLRAAAEKELDNYRPLVTTNTFADLGLASPGDASKLALTNPVVMHQVTLKDVQRVVSGQTATLRSRPQVWFPVHVDGQVRALLVMERSWLSWNGVIFGMPRTAHDFTAAQQLVATQTNSVSDIAAVRVGSVNFLALAFTSGGVLTFVPLRNLPDAGLNAGQPRPAGEVLPILYPLLESVAAASQLANRPVAR
jgi:hypothetical protein